VHALTRGVVVRARLRGVGGGTILAPMRTSILPILLALALGSCSDEAPTETLTPDQEAEAEEAEMVAAGASEAEIAARRIDREFPLHAAIRGIQLRIHQQPDEDSTVVGWVRMGARVRLAGDPRSGGGCPAFHRVHPTGWLCAREDDVRVSEEPIEIELPTETGWHDTPSQAEVAEQRGVLVLPPVARDAPLPYDYWYVKEPTVSEWHRLPSRNEQRAAIAKAERFQQLLGTNEARAWRYLRGESEDGPPGTAVTHRYLQHGFYIATTGVEVRAQRRFVRTTQGRYVKQSRLESRHGAEFHGVELGDERTLPVAWTTRTSHLQIKREAEDGSISWVDDEEREPLERQTLLEGWRDRRNVGGRVVHEIETPEGMRYLRHFRASVARAIERPEEVAEDEPWIHVDLSEQTLVMYRGDEAIYATLVSTGLEEHATPTGVYEIRRKHITDTMSNIGGGEDEDYRIEDVPYTQYFEGSFALHTAFWHTRFGLPRSHGCVNMAPADAHWVFQRTWPELPEGWHGASTDQTEFRGSHVVVTE